MSSRPKPEQVSRKDAKVAKKSDVFVFKELSGFKVIFACFAALREAPLSLFHAFTTAAFVLLCLTSVSWAAAIKVVPSDLNITPGETFTADVIVEGIPSGGLGAIQFRLNVSAPGSTVKAISDTGQALPADISVSSPLAIGPATASRSGIGDFFWNAKGSNGILVMENEALQNGSGMYTLGHTNGAALPSGSGSVARFQINAGSNSAAESIQISLSDVVLLEGGTEYPIENNTGATINLTCNSVVPNLIGMTNTEATNALSAAKLSIGIVYEIDNSAGTHALNTVLVQSVTAGATVICETPIDIAVNVPPAEVSNVHAADKTGDESGRLVFSWIPSPSSDVAGYRVYNASGTRLTDIAGAGAAGVEISGLTNGQSQQFRITAYDTHENESAGAAVSGTALDDVAPRITVNGVNENAYYSSDVQPVIIVQETNPAVQEITLNSAAYGGLPVTLDGTYLLKVTASDISGNNSINEVSFVVDKTRPVISVSGIEKNRYYNIDLAPDVSVTDANLEQEEILLNSSAYVSGTVITGENTYELLIQARDKAGNNANDTYPFFIDKTKPASTISVGMPQFENGGLLYVAGATPFTLTGSDAGVVQSGVDKLEYRASGAIWNQYQTPVTFAGLNDGTLAVEYRAVDRATNTEDFHTLPVTLDSTAPMTTRTLGQPQYIDAAGATYVTHTTSFTLSATDALSGVAVTEYKLDAGAWITAAPFTIPAEGEHIVLYRSRDNVENREIDNSFTAVVDNTPPATTITAGDLRYTAADGKLFVTSGTTFTLSATDNLSGVAVTEYRIDGGNWNAYAPFTVAGEGEHTIHYYSRDNVTNTEALKTLSVIVDNAAPVTTITTSNPKYTAADGKLYVTSGTTFSLSATDNLSGVAITEYRIDGGSWIAYAPFTVAGEGEHTIHYYSRDNVTNTEALKTLSVIVDNAAPVTTITTSNPKYTAADGKLYVTSGTTFSLSVTDNLSGVAVTEYRIDGGNWTAYAPFRVAGEGEHIIHYYSKDNVINTEAFRTLAVIVDNTAPVTTITTGNPKYTAADGRLYVTSATAFTLSATDNLSGVAATEYRIDGGAWTAYAPFTLAGEGTHTIDYYSKDNVTNIETFKTLAVIVDNAAPVTTITTGDPQYTAPDGKLYVTRGTTFTLSATDNLSGVSATEYRIDGGNWTTYAPFTVAAEGTHIVDYYSRDNVTNTEMFKTLAVIVDNTPPVSTITVDSPQYQSDGKLYVSGSTRITIEASDAVSGVKRIEYSMHGGDWNAYVAPFTLTSYDGTHTIQYRSIDNVTNREDTQELVVVLDTTPPQTVISASDELIDGVINVISPKTFLTLTATDVNSGVKSIAYRIDGSAWQAYTGSFNFADVSAGQHTVGFKATDNVLNEEAEKTITVRLIIIDVEKKIAVDSVILVGFESDKSDSEQKQADIQRLNALLTSLNITYTMAQEMDEFTSALRSGRYNTYILVDVKQPVIGQEVREAIHSGDGLIFIKTKPNADPFLDDVFGVTFSGKTTSENLSIDLLSSPISSEGTLQTSGKSVVSTITSTTTAQIFGSVLDKKNVYPSVIFNRYEQGKMLLYTFDLLRASDQSLASALLIESLNLVRPAAEIPRALASVPLRITLSNSNESVEVKVTETFPSVATVDTVIPNVTPADNTLTWRKSIAADEKTRFGYYLNLPDLPGNYLTKTEVSYNNNGLFRPYGQYELMLTVINGSGELHDKIISDLRNIKVDKAADNDLVAAVIDRLLLIDVSAANRKQSEDNIRHIIEAIDELRKISINVSTIRIELDQLLNIWEKKWYLME